MIRYTKGKRGFTLIELMLVIAMVGVLASIATPSYLNYAQKARASQCHIDRGEAQNVIIQYYQSHPDTEITSLQQLVNEGYLRHGFNCPLGGEYVLIPATVAGSQYPIVVCSLHYLPELIPESTPVPTPEPTPQPTPVAPVEPVEPVTPVEPVKPLEPEKPAKPEKPVKPEKPEKPKKSEMPLASLDYACKVISIPVVDLTKQITIAS